MDDERETIEEKDVEGLTEEDLEGQSEDPSLDDELKSEPDDDE